MRKHSLVTLAAGSLLGAAALAPAHAAQGNPFEAQPLKSGYQLAQAGDKKKDASCGGEKKAADKMGGDKMGTDKMAGDKKKDAGCGATKK